MNVADMIAKMVTGRKTRVVERKGGFNYIELPPNPDVIKRGSKVTVQAQDDIFVGYVTRVQRQHRDGLYYMTFHVAEFRPGDTGTDLDPVWAEALDKDIGDVLGSNTTS